VRSESLRSRVTVTLLVALAASQTACIAVQYVSPRRAQDANAARTMRRLMTLENDYCVRTGSYSRSFSEIVGRVLRLAGRHGCVRGYCYSLEATSFSYEIRALPETPQSGYRSFYADQRGVLRFSMAANAGPTDQALW
jgi:hypothetical protein